MHESFEEKFDYRQFPDGCYADPRVRTKRLAPERRLEFAGEGCAAEATEMGNVRLLVFQHIFGQRVDAGC